LRKLEEILGLEPLLEYAKDPSKSTGLNDDMKPSGSAKSNTEKSGSPAEHWGQAMGSCPKTTSSTDEQRAQFIIRRTLPNGFEEGTT
jgi:hypothetical protein